MHIHDNEDQEQEEPALLLESTQKKFDDNPDMLSSGPRT